MFTGAESQLILLRLRQRNYTLYNAVSRSLHDGFATHLISMSQTAAFTVKTMHFFSSNIFFNSS